MKRSILLLLFSSAFTSLHALTDLPTKTYSRQDTALAVQQLFADKRSVGKTRTMIGTCFTAGGLIVLPTGAGVLAVGLVPLSLGLIKQTKFRRHREEILLKDYQAGIALPKRIQRRLKAKYFG